MVTANSTLKALRIASGLTQEELALRADVSTRTISRAETGGSVSLQTIESIARVLGEPLEHVIQPNELVTPDLVPKPLSRMISQAASDRVLKILQEDFEKFSQVADEAKVSVKTLRNWLTGKNIPSGRTSRRMIDVLLAEKLIKPEETNEQESFFFSDAITIPNPVHTRNNTDKLRELAEAIPSQNPLIRFEVSPNNKLKLIPSLNDENDYAVIEALRSELLASNGPIATLKERYATNPNLPQSSLFKPLTEGYDKELSKDPKDINYAVLYAKGARFYAARRTAAQQVASGEWPELGPDEADAVDAICDLHGPLIMASSVGRRMVSDAHEYETTPDVYRKEQEIVEELGEVISAETEIFEAETVEDIQALTPPIENDPQPARTRRAGVLVAGSVLTVVVGGAAWLAGGSTALYFAVPAAAGYWGQKYAWEVLKKTDAFKASSDEDAKRADALIKQAEEQIGPHQKRLMEKMSQLVERQRPLFEKVASLRPEFSWAKKFIKSSNQTGDKVPLDLGDAIRSAASRLIDPAGRQKIRITESGLTSEAVVLGNRVKLETAFYELIQNALHHGKTVTEIDIRLDHIDFTSRASAASTYLVSIRDNGRGVPVEHMDNIWKLGYTTSPEGTGQGLYVVRQIIEEHSGKVTFESEWGKGMTINISLPAYLPT